MNINTSEKEYIKKFVLNIEFEDRNEIVMFNTILYLAICKINSIEHDDDFKKYREIISLIDKKLMIL